MMMLFISRMEDDIDDEIDLDGTIFDGSNETHMMDDG